MKCFFKVFLAGSILKDGPVKVLEDKELDNQPAPRILKVTFLFPSMLHVSSVYTLELAIMWRKTA